MKFDQSKIPILTIFEAIPEMGNLTKKVGTLSLTFMSYSHERGTSSGIIEVQSARLRPRNKIEFNQYAELQEE